MKMVYVIKFGLNWFDFEVNLDYFGSGVELDYSEIEIKIDLDHFDIEVKDDIDYFGIEIEV